MISTRILDDASSMLATTVLVDKIDVYTRGELITVGYDTERRLDPFAIGYPALVQSTVLANAVESTVDHVYSIKVAQATPLEAGMVVEVKECTQEPDLVGVRLLVDKMSSNGLAIIRKGVASYYSQVDPQGKDEM